MKKILLFVSLTCFTFAGCSKGDGEKEPQLDDRLINTKWQTRASAYEIVYGGTAYDVYEFVSTTEVENYTTKNGNVVDSNGSFAYELNYPSLVIHKDAETSYEYEFMDSRTIVRVGANENMPYMKYIKQ